MDDLCVTCNQLFTNHPNAMCEMYMERTEYASCTICGHLTDAACTDHETPVPVCLNAKCVEEHDKRFGHEDDEPLLLDQVPPMPARIASPRIELLEDPLPQDSDKPDADK